MGETERGIMTRDEITLELGRLVRSRIDRQCPLWGAEVDVPTGREDVPIGRVDFAGFTPYGYGYGYVPDASSLERGSLTCYEVKSCMDDFRSGHGLNFVGDVNWLVCPFELCDQLRRAQALPQAAGVLCPDASWRRLLVKIENPCKAYSDIRRSMTAAEAVWRIARVSYRAMSYEELNRHYGERERSANVRDVRRTFGDGEEVREDATGEDRDDGDE